MNMPSFQILNLLRTLSSWGSINYRPSAPLLHVKKTAIPANIIIIIIIDVLLWRYIVGYASSNVGPTMVVISVASWTSRKCKFIVNPTLQKH